MISESGSESSTTMSSAPLTTSKTRDHTDDAIKRKKKKKRAIAKIDDRDDADHTQIKLTKKCKETKLDNGDVARLPVEKKSSIIKSEIIGGKSNHSKSKNPRQIIGESSDDPETQSLKSESRDKKSGIKLPPNGIGQKDKSLRGGSSKTKEKKRYEEIEIDGITINAFRTWEDLQDELNDRISEGIKRNATISATNSSDSRFLDSEVSRAHTSNDSSLGINGVFSNDSHEPSSSGLMKSSPGSVTQGMSKNLNASYQNERNLNVRCNTNTYDPIGQANTLASVSKLGPPSNELPVLNQSSNQNISHRHQEQNNDNQHNQHRHHHRHHHHHHHDSKHSRSHTKEEMRTDERVQQQQQQQNPTLRHQAATLGPPVFERAISDFKRQQQQHQMDFFGRPPSPPQPSSRVPQPAPPPASHTAHQYFQQYHQLYQHMQNSTQHSLSLQQPPLPPAPPPPPLPFPHSHHPPLHHQQNPYMQSLIDHHHHQQQQQHQHLHQHHMPPVPPSPYMSPFTITDTIHTISRQTIIPPPMMPQPPSLPTLPGLEQLSVTSRYGMGPGPGRMSALEHSHLASHQPPSYTPSPTERSFMEFARSYANASNLSSNYSSLTNQSPLAKGPPSSASLYGQLDRISHKSELHHAFGAAGLGSYPGAYPGPGGRAPANAWQLPGW